MNKSDLNQIKHHYAGIFLITKSGKVIGQQRDYKPNIDNPGKIATFGGTVEDGEEPKNAVWRELTQEETNLKLNIENIKHLTNDIACRDLTNEWEARHFYYVSIKNADLETMEVYEGSGWAYINGPNEYKLVESWRPITKLLFEKLKLHP